MCATEPQDVRSAFVRTLAAAPVPVWPDPAFDALDDLAAFDDLDDLDVLAAFGAFPGFGAVDDVAGRDAAPADLAAEPPDRCAAGLAAPAELA
jgi:hypothetical protein